MSEWVEYGVGQGIRLTKTGKSLWCKMEDGEVERVPLNQISERSEIQDVGDMGMLIVSKWWADLPRVRLPGSSVDPDHRLELVDDKTAHKIHLRVSLRNPRYCRCGKSGCPVCTEWWDQRNRDRDYRLSHGTTRTLPDS